MAKILLVEDDNNLREIYEARLQAEGYEIVSARDGEEALVVAKAEKPDLVISDVMMPKISGFEMLDILRNTDGLKQVKVIMLTALGQSDDQQRADKLGADRYLVKSQVTLEDIVKAAHDLLGDSTSTAPAAAGASAPTADPSAPATPTTAAQSSDDQVMNDAVNSLIADTSKTDSKDPKADDKTDDKKDDSDQTPSVTKKVIKPLDKKPGKDIQTLLAEEEAKENGQATDAPSVTQPPEMTVAPTNSSETDSAPAPTAPSASSDEKSELKTESEPKQKPDSTGDTPAAPTTAAEEAAVDAKIEDFVAGASSEPTPPLPPKPEAEVKPAAPTTAPVVSTPPSSPASNTPPATPGASTPPSQTPPAKPPSDPNIIAL